MVVKKSVKLNAFWVQYQNRFTVPESIWRSSWTRIFRIGARVRRQKWTLRICANSDKNGSQRYMARPLECHCGGHSMLLSKTTEQFSNDTLVSSCYEAFSAVEGI
jgi:hypothetical protein